MTSPDTVSTTDPHAITDAFVAYVLAIRQSSTARSALKRGESPTTDRYTDPYLTRFWANRPHMREPMVVFASLAAAFDNIPHAPGFSPGALIRELDHRRVFGTDRAGDSQELAPIEIRLGTLQSQPLSYLRRFLVRCLNEAEKHRLGLDWEALWNLIRSWDHPAADIQARTRRTLGAQFWAHRIPDPTTTPDTPDINDELPSSGPDTESDAQ